MPFSAPNASGVPSAQDLGHFPAREAGGIPFRAGKDAFFCSKCLWGTFCAGFGAFSCPGGGWYPILSVGKMQLSCAAEDVPFAWRAGKAFEGESGSAESLFDSPFAAVGYQY